MEVAWKWDCRMFFKRPMRTERFGAFGIAQEGAGQRASVVGQIETDGASWSFCVGEFPCDLDGSRTADGQPYFGVPMGLATWGRVLVPKAPEGLFESGPQLRLPSVCPCLLGDLLAHCGGQSGVCVSEVAGRITADQIQVLPALLIPDVFPLAAQEDEVAQWVIAPMATARTSRIHPWRELLPVRAGVG